MKEFIQEISGKDPLQLSHSTFSLVMNLFKSL